MGEPGPSAGVYGITVAAELTGLTVRSLRLFERHGLLRPARTEGGTRRFSRDDLRRARRIADLMADGVNLAGIGKILDLEQDTDDLRGDNTALRADNTALRADNTALHEDNTALQEDNTRLTADQPPRPARQRRRAGETETTRRSRHSPAQGHRDQPSRPG